MKSAEENRIQELIYENQRKEDALGITHETSEHGRLHRDYYAAEAVRKTAAAARKAGRKARIKAAAKSWWCRSTK